MSLTSVAVTGIGIISPLGNSYHTLIEQLQGGHSGIAELPALACVGGLRSRLAATVRNVDARQIPRKYRRSMSNMSVYAYLASLQALAMAEYPPADIPSGQLGVIIGSTLGSTATSEDFFQDYFKDYSLERMKSGLFFQLMGHSCAANVAQSLGVTGRVMAPSAACATSCQAIGYAYEQIVSGKQQAILCGGADELHPLTVATFDVLNAASTAWNECPDDAPGPFDRRRDGVICGEGGGILLLESSQSARRRGATILAEVIGFATSSDTSSIANPDVGEMERCMRLALADADLTAADIDYINAHATGTGQGDIAEAEAIRAVFSDRVPVSSLKGHLGHTMAASGAIELAGSVGMLERQQLFATRNLQQVDERCSGIHHLQQNLERSVKTILKNNFAMGGINCTIIIRSHARD